MSGLRSVMVMDVNSTHDVDTESIESVNNDLKLMGVQGI